jgi:hypothetical protein
MKCVLPAVVSCISQDIISIFQDLAVHTRINPNERNVSLRRFIENVKQNEDANRQLEDWGLELDMNTIQLDGRQLVPENIVFRGGMTRGNIEADWGRELNRQKVISAVSTSLVYLFSCCLTILSGLSLEAGDWRNLTHIPPLNADYFLKKFSHLVVFSLIFVSDSVVCQKKPLDFLMQSLQFLISSPSVSYGNDVASVVVR